jgi:hypothetical protein
MLLSVTLLVVSVLALPVLVALVARRWGTEEARTESALRSPGAHTVRYVVPEGEDPAQVRAALTHARFVSVLDRGGDQGLLVRCEASQRERLRSIIEEVQHTAFVGRLGDGDHVRFADEVA